MKSSLVTLAESYGISLKKVGKVYQGLCPFHDDTNPSFTIFPETDTFYCFGCGVVGDAQKFLKLIDPTFKEGISVNFSSLKSTLEKIDKRQYKKYVLYISSKIFHELFKKYPVSSVLNIMRRFDKFISSKEELTLQDSTYILERLEKLK
ncbi:MAG: CHC2 zinc finger domain-containing protein [Candidatus Micrarchaeia archaeon]